ncbi:MAG: hypothetical protein ABI779_21080 [Acidobacteriota bacterium]
MPDLYVRMEAVNLFNFVEDVHDLSTIRGGSFLLLDAVLEVEQEFHLRRISSGASAGLFTIASERPAAELRRDIERFLHRDHRRHATFVVDVAPVTSFVRDRESLAAMNRWRQFQQPTLAVPSNPATPSNKECDRDHVRPAAHVESTPDGKDTIDVSASAHVRREKGRKEKQKFYAKELRELGMENDPSLNALIEKVKKAEFAHDLEALTGDESKKSLHAKMAVLYFDGNSFGTKQRECDSPEVLTRLDTAIKTCRRRVLRSLMETITSSRDNGWWTKSDEIRLETLLWGGDELIWVVPAWKGWEVMQLFYEQTAGCAHDRQALTHAGGIVFCHHAAPIHRMRHTAIALADLSKKFLKSGKVDPGHAESDLFAYQVFESFDLIEGDLKDYRAKRAPLSRKETASDELLVRAQGMGNVAADFDVVRRGFPRSKLHDILLALRGKEGGNDLATATVDKLPTEERDALRRLFHFFGRNSGAAPWDTAPTAWFHLAELWDYVPAPAKEVHP